jgi:hypothetical protein
MPNRNAPAPPEGAPREEARQQPGKWVEERAREICSSIQLYYTAGMGPLLHFGPHRVRCACQTIASALRAASERAAKVADDLKFSHDEHGPTDFNPACEGCLTEGGASDAAAAIRRDAGIEK